ncbi:leucine-rich repeat-containing protein 49 isoform X3 [Canis lupus baileyi]|uniref:Leucine-rich repeat-containing protein 49 n=1 Tax=Canis lupus dingo TaxID=286419 RepID=A0A8C0QWY7_CANLU|nr:leucine-rich repeat-containing protein 49 isoform X2 [Canis lupus familiaris]XP_025328083.1 leucine-rich repeat-containing protein 49 isoform X3 [Canis lupus dingo]XP_038298751.1 leucine-rich repeat-containing protein 49 isoform X2 [Canis lupus familiaris]XP_038436783.1 leucine-rich repeat-containing protein 49 isoform X2 [Canis lupus familiaris]|eukprot:XP_003433980.1 leucine-rich repeat-containing protein 49 isoform X4 [Canis lupus familiaris]
MIPGKYRSVSGRAANNVNCGLHLVIQTSSLPEKSKVEFKLNKETPSFSGRLLQHDLERNYSSRQGDHINLASSSMPSFPILQRSSEEKILYSDRLTLERQKLTVCPIIDGEEHLRLLNFQHNFITRIQNISNLQRLIFLDLYDNQIEEISGLSTLRSLRVLLLGKNRIKKISNLENLKSLDVLDLHGNQITKIENVNHLCDLRVLNLARNLLSHVDNLNGLDSLTELNLRHNQITFVRDVDNLPCLQRLFLSFNNISTFESVCCLADSSSLSDITFDGNPIAQESWYKHTILQNMMQLRQLDMKRVTEEERRMASIVAKKEEEKKRESHKQSLLKEKKRLTINNVARKWDLQQHRIPNIAPNQDRKVSDSPQDPSQLHGSTISAFPEETGSLDSGLTSALQGLSVTDTHLVEVDGDTLSLYGSGALESLDRNWSVQTAGMVTTVSFTFIEFDEIVQVLPKLKIKFPNSLHLKFKETNLVMLQQFNALAQLRRVDQLTIDPQGNPVVNFTLWKYYVLFRLSHFSMQKINGTEVTQNDMIMAERLFGILAHVASSELPQYRLISILGDARKKQFRYLLETKGKKPGLVNEENSDSKRLVGENTNRATLNYTTRDFYNERLEEIKEKKKFCKMYMEDLVKEATEINMKNEALQKLWPQMFIELVRDAVIEIRNKSSYMKLCLQQITDQK